MDGVGQDAAGTGTTAASQWDLSRHSRRHRGSSLLMWREMLSTPKRKVRVVLAAPTDCTTVRAAFGGVYENGEHYRQDSF